jgi:hypothetical protein
MRTVRELGPVALVVAVIGVVTWALLAGGDAIGAWLLAGLVLAHGLIHLMFLVRPPAATARGTGPAWPFDLDRSWLLREPGRERTVRRVGAVLVAITVACAVLGALAIVGVLVPREWWNGLVVSAAVSSLLLIAIGFSPMLLVGVGIDVALLWLGLVSGRAPA